MSLCHSIIYYEYSTCGKALADAGDWLDRPAAEPFAPRSTPEFVGNLTDDSILSNLSDIMKVGGSAGFKPFTIAGAGGS